jgi:hypothetical protein
MASPVLDFGAFSPTELQAYLTAAKAEYLLRLTTGRVQQGSSVSQSYGLNVISMDQLTTLINGLSAALGLTSVPDLVQPNFNTRGPCFPLQNTFGA